ncbi:MAG TPA: FAD-binding protein [Stellaceae bacterium]|nr:FAD-binding protein [Stellaceae bacterium]
MSERRVITTDGGERSVNGAAIDKLAATLRGRLLGGDDPDYDEVRSVWNGMIDKRPALIARCAGAADVVSCVRFAREHNLLVSVRGGGHNYAGKSVCEGGLMIDLSLMKGIRLDPAARTARAQPGLRLGEFDRETQAFGLATTLGVNTDTGIAGLTLGGGYGWLGGKFGLACDNLLSADVVTADGRLVVASATENEDLFWGLRGAGANLGIVTSFEYQLHTVGPVLGGILVYPLSRGREVLRFFDEFSRHCPDEVTTLSALLTAPTGDPVVAVGFCYCGPLDQGEKLLHPLTALGAPLANGIAVQPYVKVQAQLDAQWPPGRLYYLKSNVVRRLEEPAIDQLVEWGRKMPTPRTAIAFQQLHGAASRVRSDATAFPHRYDHYSMYIEPATDDPADAAKIIHWGRECWDAMRPFIDRAVYVNAMEDPGGNSEQSVRDAYGPNYQRLAALKQRYDPSNFLTGNQNIRPAE